MNPALTGKAAAVAAEKPWVILATDRHRTGQDVLAVTEKFKHKFSEAWPDRFVRFATETDAHEWLEENGHLLDGLKYRYTVTDL